MISEQSCHNLSLGKNKPGMFLRKLHFLHVNIFSTENWLKVSMGMSIGSVMNNRQHD